MISIGHAVTLNCHRQGRDIITRKCEARECAIWVQHKDDIKMGRCSDYRDVQEIVSIAPELARSIEKELKYTTLSW